MTMLHEFWEAALTLDPAAPAYRDRTSLGGPDGLRELWGSAGLEDVSIEAIDVEAEYSGFDELWGTFALGIGPAGSYCASLDPERRDALRDELLGRLGDHAPLTLEPAPGRSAGASRADRQGAARPALLSASSTVS